jgi:hypothetical protein
MERVKFYADNEKLGQKNKLFTFEILGALYVGNTLLRFAKRVDFIRAAWYEFINEETGEIENRRIDMNHFYECLNDRAYKDPTDLIKFTD